MLIYRIENPVGKGPYVYPRPCDASGEWSWKCTALHPGPLDDQPLAQALNAAHNDDWYERVQPYQFAFASLDQLYAWVDTPAARSLLREHFFNITLLAACDVLVGSAQVMYRPETAKRLARFKL